MARRPWVAALGLVVSGCGERATEPAPPARIVIVSMDTVRADRVTGYGDADTTPELARIAADGVLFQNAYAASNYTIPSHMSIFTGLDPVEHGLIRGDARLADGVPTLAELLKHAGWRTMAFHEGGYVGSRFGFDRGFERYVSHERVAVVDEDLDDVLAWIREAPEGPYLLFVHTYAAHFPYGGYERYRDEAPDRGLPTDAELDRLRAEGLATGLADAPLEARVDAVLHNHLARRYDEFIKTASSNRFPAEFLESPDFDRDVAAMLTSYENRIRLVDRALGAIRVELERRGHWDDTLLVVLSDHGEGFFEHRMPRHDYVPFDEALRVPLVVSWPRVLADRARVVDDLVWHLDLFPTLLRLAGLEPRAEEPDRRDLTPVLLGADLGEDRAVFPSALRPAHLPQEPLRRIVVTRDWKYIEGHERFGDAQGLLFDRARDPGETHNLRRAEPDVVRALTALIEDRDETLEPVGGPAPTIDALPADELDRLRELGYVDDGE